MEGYRELERMTSRNSKVSVVERPDTKVKYILKLYPNHYCLDVEVKMMQRLQGKCRTPKIIKATDRELLMENVGGRMVLQELINGPMFKINMLAGAFAHYLQDFYAISEGMIINEISLYNYMIKGVIIYAFDFTSLASGTAEDMIAETVSAVLMDDNVIDMRKSIFIREFLRVSGKTALQLKEKILNTLRAKITAYGSKDKAEDLFRKIG